MGCFRLPAFIFVLFLSFVYGLEEIQRTPNFYVDWENDRFVKDGSGWQYVAGGFHYFRTVPEHWARTISTAKSAGLNAIQSYVTWDEHEPQKGKYDFSGRMDIVRFIEEVQKQDMALILRVGPYICAEKSFGGLPAWLLTVPDMEVRTTNPAFMSAVKEWLGVLLKKIRPLLYNNGGPIIMVQIENEYGIFGCDGEYLSQLYDMFYTELGDEVVYFTTDGPGDYTCGSYNNTKVLTTIDYLEDNDKGQFTEQYFQELREYQPRGPLVNSEYYTGWLDKWGSPHKTRSAVTLKEGIRKLLSLHANLALFVWHGGSNFGLDGSDYTATSTYDYDAPISESGDIKPEKYWAVRDAIDQFFPGNLLPVPENIPKLSGKTVHLAQGGSLIDLVSRENFIVYNRYPLKMEEMDEFEGMLGYQHELTTPLVDAQLQLHGLHDRAYVLADGQFVQVVRREEEASFPVTARSTLTILVENMGYMAWLSQGLGDYSNEYKGMKNVTVNGQILEKWKHYKMETSRLLEDEYITRNDDVTSPENTQNITQERHWYNEKPLLNKGPTAFSGELELTSAELLDTFVDSSCWSKGFLVVNGHVVERYWPEAGPQYTLFLPGVFLREGGNTFTMVELQSVCQQLTLTLTNEHIIDGPVNGDLI